MKLIVLLIVVTSFAQAQNSDKSPRNVEEPPVDFLNTDIKAREEASRRNRPIILNFKKQMAEVFEGYLEVQSILKTDKLDRVALAKDELERTLTNDRRVSVNPRYIGAIVEAIAREKEESIFTKENIVETYRNNLGDPGAIEEVNGILVYYAYRLEKRLGPSGRVTLDIAKKGYYADKYRLNELDSESLAKANAQMKKDLVRWENPARFFNPGFSLK